MKKYFISILCVLSLNMSCAQGVKKNLDTKFIEFIHSFEEETKAIFDFRVLIQRNDAMSEEEALLFVYETNDTNRLSCVAFDFSNEDEEFRGIIGVFPRIPKKCLKIDVGNYFLIAYSAYQCTHSCPDPNNLYDCFVNDEQIVFLTLCIVDKGYNLIDSMIVCSNSGYEYDITGLLNANNSKIFLLNTNTKKEALMYAINQNLQFEIIKKMELSDDIPTDDLNWVLKHLDWETLFFN